ncbi:MAG: glyoxalase [Gammaproteobacteria bacterium RIFCSPLOWO2_02_FULL_57_10]|nr:MAG: glyoxalase [Gammaproteobacteria bacterium RIFCSPLOWO2_02_FULL_57_10]
MASVSTYLNFPGTTEQAFMYYKKVFGTEFIGAITRMRDVPADPSQPPLAEADLDLICNIALPITGGHLLMGTDACESMGFHLVQGNNVFITLHPESREETDRLFAALAEGGQVDMPLQDMFWGDYFGTLTDRFGTKWMFNFGPSYA